MTAGSHTALYVHTLYVCVCKERHTFVDTGIPDRRSRPLPWWWRPRLRPCRRSALSSQRRSYPTTLRPPGTCCTRTLWRKIKWRLNTLLSLLSLCGILKARRVLMLKKMVSLSSGGSAGGSVSGRSSDGLHQRTPTDGPWIQHDPWWTGEFSYCSEVEEEICGYTTG